MPMLWRSAALSAGLLAVPAGLPAHADGDAGFAGNGIKRVLLISIDGMHALDFINCAQGISGVNGGNPYCPSLAELAGTGVNYLETSTSKPSDSFPGLMALVTGGSPRSVGAFYDVAYDRSLDPPATTTGNGVFGAPGLCTSGAAPMGTTTEFDEGIDIDQTLLNGGAPVGVDGGIASIDPMRLERDPAHNCNPVYPWNFVRTNTIARCRGLHRLVGQASFLLVGLGSWQRHERRRLLLAGNQLYSGSAAHRARLQPASGPECRHAIERLDRRFCQHQVLRQPEGVGDPKRDQRLGSQRHVPPTGSEGLWDELPSG